MRFPGSTRTRFLVILILAASLLAFDTIRKNRMAAEQAEREKAGRTVGPPIPAGPK